MKAFKDIVNTATVVWATEGIKEKIKQVQQNSEKDNDLAKMAGMHFDKDEMNQEFNKLTTQLTMLKTFGDVLAYAKSNVLNPEDFMPGRGNQNKLIEILSGKSDLSVGKLLARIQISSCFSTIIKNAEVIRDMLDKIGRDTPIDQVNLDDVDYLLNKGMKDKLQLLKEEVMKHPEAKVEIGGEVEQLNDPNLEWTKRKIAKDVIKIYFSKFKDEFLKNKMSLEAIAGGEYTSEAGFEDFAKLADAIINLSAEIEFANELFKELKKGN